MLVKHLNRSALGKVRTYPDAFAKKLIRLGMVEEIVVEKPKAKSKEKPKKDK